MLDNAKQRDPFEELAAEFMNRSRDGSVPSIEDYASEYPEHASSIRELFPTIAALEKVKKDDRKVAARSATLKPLKLTELGDFEIVREIGRGGMGIVYEAVQKSLGRKVALKVLPKQALLDPAQLRRFRREARIAARLHHTNIVSLYGVGEHDGFHFLVMELIDGAPLNEVICRLSTMCGAPDDTAASRVLAVPKYSANPKVNQLAKQLLSGENIRKRTSCDIVEHSNTHKIYSSRARAKSRKVKALIRSVPLNRHDKKEYYRNVAEIGRDAACATPTRV